MKGCTLMLTRCEEAGQPIDLDLPIGRLSRMDSMQQQRMVPARLRIAGSDGGKKRWEFARRTRYRCQTLPKVQFAGHTLECLEGANLRVVLLRARLPLYTRVARAVHCRGHGTCGTCAVRIDGPVATLWAPYDFYSSVEFSHCGTDAFQLAKTPEGWKVISVSYTAQMPPTCGTHPEGPPKPAR